MIRRPVHGTIDVRFFQPPRSVTVRLVGLDPFFVRRAMNHWAADTPPAAHDKSARPVTVRVESLSDKAPGRAGHTVTASGDVLSLPGGRLRLHPEHDEVVVSLGGGSQNLTLDVLDAAVAVALARRGVLLVHAAAFQHGSTAVVAVGASGSGKSTLTAVALRAGGRVVSDDTVLVRASDGALQVHPFRSHLDLRGDPAAVLPPALATTARRTTKDRQSRWRLDLASLHPSSYTQSIEPSHLWVLSLDRRLGRSRVTRLTQSEALAALVAAASPLVLSPRYRTTRAVLLPVARTLAESSAAWRVRLAPDLLRDPEAALARLFDATV